jgi:hypothetical protein
MALTGHFLNFREEVYRVRKNMIVEIYNMIVENPITPMGDFSINMGNEQGNQEVKEITYSPSDDTVFIITDGDSGDERYVLDELLTDDLVALYEFVFGVLYPDENKFYGIE